MSGLEFVGRLHKFTNKPRLYLRGSNFWLCVSLHSVGRGYTPQAAWLDWRRNGGKNL